GEQDGNLPVARLALQTFPSSYTPIHQRIRAFRAPQSPVLPPAREAGQAVHRRILHVRRLPGAVRMRCYDLAAYPNRRWAAPARRNMLDADHPREACGVFGVWAPGEQVANLVFYGLYALQHRGQESAGMAVADGRGVLVYKEMGLVSQVFNEAALATLQGHLASGDTRYSTTA